jgi:amino acid transporter
VQREDNGGTPAGFTAASPGLGLWDAVSIIIGIVIGAGIYETAPLVLANVSSPAAGLMVWVVGGVLSLVGAACYAELASTYPRSGGDYVYLTKAFGPLSGFLFGWAQLTVILTGSIGMMAYVFSDYAIALFGLGSGAGVVLAASAVLALTLLNLKGASLGTKAQNVLSLVKLLGVLGVVVTGVAVAAQGVPELPAKVPSAVGEAAPGVSLGLAMILVLYTFGGWNDAAFVAAEVRNRKRNLPRALLLGTAAITLIYLAMNAAFLFALGFERARTSQAIARDLFVTAFGPAGGAAISLLVMISALGAVNALIFTGSRLHATLGVDYSALSRLGVWHAKTGSPMGALLAQMAITLTMIALVGTLRGRAWIDGALTSVGLSPASWSGHGGFDTLLSCTAPVFWLFFLMTGISLFRLRRTDPARPRPFRVPFYPLTPLLFCGTCAYMLYSSVAYAGTLTLFGIAPLLLGVPVYFASKRRPAADRAMPEPVASGAE